MRMGSMLCPHCREMHPSAEICFCEGAHRAQAKYIDDAIKRSNEPAMLKIGIALDDWKLPVFRKRLTEAGFSYEDAGGLTAGTTVLTVETDNLLALKKVIERCQMECRK